MLHYSENQIRTARVLLETISVAGYENCKNVVLLRQILDSDIKETEDGKTSGGNMARGDAEGDKRKHKGEGRTAE